MLGALVACDVVTFWAYGWSIRSQITPSWPELFCGFLVTGTYFVAASLIFPATPEKDHDAHFAENYRIVLGGFLLCNCALLGWLISISGIDGLIGLREIVIV